MSTSSQIILVPPIWLAGRTFGWPEKPVTTETTCQVDWTDWLLYHGGLSFALPPQINSSDSSLSVTLGEWQDGVVTLTLAGGLPGTTPVLQITVILSDATASTIAISQPIAATDGAAGATSPAVHGGYLLLPTAQSLASLPLVASAGNLLPVVRVQASDGSLSLGVTPFSSGGGGTGTLELPQVMPSAVWVLRHFLNKFPIIMTLDSANNEVEGSVAFDSPNQATVTFSAAFSGVAFLT